MYDKIFSEIFDIFSSELERRGIALPSVSEIAGEDNDPYRILTSTILSLRTKDKVTIERSKALFEKAPDIYSLYEMNTDELAETIKPSAFYKRKAENLKEIAGIIIKKYDVIILNYANPDMVGHTGSLEATIKALEFLDGCVKRVVDAIENNDGTLLITADHGNAEQMIDYKTGELHTAHTTNPVPLVLIGREDVKLKEGRLADLAPTMLDLMNLAKPAEMTGESLIEK